MSFDHVRSVACSALVLFIAATGAAQQMRQQDPTPFEPPKPICTLKIVDLDVAVNALAKVLAVRGFSLESTSEQNGQIFAKKVDGDAEDRVLIWLERDLAKPNERFRVYFAGAIYEPFFGSS